MRPYLVFIAGCAFVLACRADPAPSWRAGQDVVVLKNGTTYNATIERPRFDLATPYGRLSVPSGLMRSLAFTPEGVVLTTRDGERVTGTLLHGGLKVTSAPDTARPLQRSDIASVLFADRPTAPSPPPMPDRLRLRNGDHMPARLLTRDLLVKTDAGVKMIDRSDIRRVDIEPVPATKGKQAVMLRLKSPGKVVLGELLMGDVTVQTPLGAPTEIALERVESIALDVRRNPDAGDSPASTRNADQATGSAPIRDNLRSGGRGPEMVPLPGGSYIRGDAEGDEDERPPTRLDIKPFAIGRYEVTFAEFDRYCEVSGSQKPNDGGWGRGRRPVINVSWKEAKGYVRWLSEQTGHRYRLPTDAEWEYAARAGTASRFWWGDEVQTAHANCEGCGSLWDGEKTATVGRFPPNPFGLYDTAGNVWEWVEDCYNDSFADGTVAGAALIRPNCGKRVIRGGAWSFPAQEIRSANRWRDFPSRRSDDTGFRVARDMD